VAYNPNILADVLKARSLTPEQLSKRLGVPYDKLQQELKREPEPKQGILNDIARELAVPSFVFYMERAPQLHDVLPDFRADTPHPTAKTRDTTESIQFAAGVQQAAVDLGALTAPVLPHFTATKQAEVEEFAAAARKFFEITLKDQADAKDAKAFYIICRKRIEDRGVFVLHDSFPETDGSGFALAHATHPLIVVNTKRQNRGRRLFTLIHELGHILMRRSGISDPFVSRNTTERLCNRFAASFLVPKQFLGALLKNATPVQNPDPDYVQFIARRLKISQQAAVLRMEQLGFFGDGSHARWLRLMHNENPDFKDKGGGAGGPPPQEKVKLAKYGFRFASVFAPLLSDGDVSEINLYRASGLKPKYQRQYFDYVKSLSDTELRDLELDDE
jgi:Zn-dependent peptidase ImmA (M78 family)